MLRIIPEIRINNQEVNYFNGAYASPGNFSSASINFSIPSSIAGYRKLWNQEVTFYANKRDSTPVFRGWIKRAKKTVDRVEIFAEDGIGYMIKGGGASQATILLDDRTNLDGLTAGAAIQKLLELTNLDEKIKTDYIGNTSPVVGTIRPPIRGEKTVKNIIKEILAQAINTDDTSMPRPNIIKLVDDGSNSQLIIELESDIESPDIKHVFDEYSNITSLQTINKKIPTVVEVVGDNGVKGRFTHTSAMEAQDREFLSVNNNNLKSPAECKEFAARIFQANLKAQYEYALEVTEGEYLTENEVVRIETKQRQFTGDYRIIGKTINFGPDQFRIGININRKPPTLAEYITSRDN
jgi:hypothetical protein